MRHAIAFTSGGLTCRGWLHEPKSPGGNAQGVVMAHGFAAVKEQGFAEFAEAFSTAGFAVLVLTIGHLGASDGAERSRIIAQEQHDDLRAALGFISMQPPVDANRIGIWGASDYCDRRTRSTRGGVCRSDIVVACAAIGSADQGVGPVECAART